jgi:hypothetical protein
VAAFEAGSEAAKPLLATLSTVWADMQRMKHALDLSRSPPPRKHADVLGQLDAAVDSLLCSYEQHGVEFPEYLRDVWHDGKNYGISLRASVRLNLRDTTEQRTLPGDVRSHIVDARNHLARLRALLEEGRERLRSDAIMGVSEQAPRSCREGIVSGRPNPTLSVRFRLAMTASGESDGQQRPPVPI